jgi:hypothetical protein
VVCITPAKISSRLRSDHSAGVGVVGAGGRGSGGRGAGGVSGGVTVFMPRGARGAGGVTVFIPRGARGLYLRAGVFAARRFLAFLANRRKTSPINASASAAVEGVSVRVR